MASFIHRALFLVLFSPLSPILFGTHSHVKADDSLIKLQCRNSETPALCIHCIKSDPAAPQADKVGIAAIVIHCLRTHSRILASNMTKMASREDDEKLRSAYQTAAKVVSGICNNIVRDFSNFKHKTPRASPISRRPTSKLKLPWPLRLRCENQKGKSMFLV